MKTIARKTKLASSYRSTQAYTGGHIDQPYDPPDADVPFEEPDEPSELDDSMPDEDDSRWDVFVLDDDEFDFEPDPRNFDNAWNDTWDNDE